MKAEKILTEQLAIGDVFTKGPRCKASHFYLVTNKGSNIVYAYNSYGILERHSIFTESYISSGTPGKSNVERVTGKNVDKFKSIVSSFYQELDTLKLIPNVIASSGGDPEFFVEDGSGEIIPAFTFLPDKTHPIKYDYRNNPDYKFPQSLYWDGVQAEFTLHPGHCLEERCDSIQDGLRNLLAQAKKANPNAKISSKTLITVSDDFLRSCDPIHIQFGCAPSKNVYGLMGMTADGLTANARSTGGHMHFGFNSIPKVNGESYVECVKWLDRIVGLLSIPLLQKYDDPKRREFYGLPGEYRETNYPIMLGTHLKGLEYRVLSNAYLFHPTSTMLCYDMARRALGLAFSTKELKDMWKGSDAEVIEAIILSNVDKATNLILQNEHLYLLLIRSAYPMLTRKQIKATLNSFLAGMHTFMKDPTDIKTNWSLETSIGVDHSNWWKYQVSNVMLGRKI